MLNIELEKDWNWCLFFENDVHITLLLFVFSSLRVLLGLKMKSKLILNIVTECLFLEYFLLQLIWEF